MIQLLQSVILTYVAYAVIFTQESMVDIFMNFAAILIVRELDDFVGAWFLTWTTPIKEQLAIKVVGF